MNGDSDRSIIQVLEGVNGAGEFRLLPILGELRVFDNSHEAPPAEGKVPCPVLVLEMSKHAGGLQ